MRVGRKSHVQECKFHSFVELIVSGRPYSSSQHQPLKMPQNQRSAQFCTLLNAGVCKVCIPVGVLFVWSSHEGMKQRFGRKNRSVFGLVMEAHRRVVTCLGWRSISNAIFRDKCGRSSYPLNCKECCREYTRYQNIQVASLQQ